MNALFWSRLLHSVGDESYYTPMKNKLFKLCTLVFCIALGGCYCKKVDEVKPYNHNSRTQVVSAGFDED